MKLLHLRLGVAIAAVFSVSIAPIAWAETAIENNDLSLRDVKQPAKTVKEWLAQVEAAMVTVTGVKLDRTEAGLDITLETVDGKPLQVDATKFRAEGNSLIADIPNAVLSLSDAQEFNGENPTSEIANVRVTQVDASSIRVNVTGKDALPKSEVTLKTAGLAYSLNPEGETPEEELVVTGDRAPSYRVPNASTATKTDTPLRDVPFSVQVVPKEILQDRRIDSLAESLRTVSGVVVDGSVRSPFEFFTIRGFSGRSIIRNGLRDDTNNVSNVAIGNIEQIDVLKGPAGALFSQGAVGGTINIVTKQPLSKPFYQIEGSVGNFDTYSGSLDFSGPLDKQGNLLYRLNAGAFSTGTFVDFFDIRRYVIAPVLTAKLGENTKVTLEGEFNSGNQPNNRGLPASGTVLPNPNGRIPFSRFTGETDFDKNDKRTLRIGYTLEHRFNQDWTLLNAFRITQQKSFQDSIFPTALLEDGRTLERLVFLTPKQQQDNYSLDTYLTGNFKTGSIKHRLLLGFDLGRDVYFSEGELRELAPIDLFNPVYRGTASLGDLIEAFPLNTTKSDSLGFYVQDQIMLADNLKLLLGGRFDIINQTNTDQNGATLSFQQNEAFSPRIGIVYQPITPISLYASYSETFQQAVGTTFDRSLFKPEKGKQYEVGIKGDITNRLSATLSYFNITRSNVSTADPVNPDFSIQTGEQTSRGVEFDLGGEILPGWKIAAAAAYIDAKISADNTFTIGNRLNNAPEFSASLWSTYEIQSGGLKGFGFGLGAFFVGERQGDLANSFQVPSYLRTDAALFYRLNKVRFALNVENLFGVRYFENAESDLRVFPGAPFMVKGTVSVQF